MTVKSQIIELNLSPWPTSSDGDGYTLSNGTITLTTADGYYKITGDNITISEVTYYIIIGADNITFDGDGKEIDVQVASYPDL